MQSEWSLWSRDVETSVVPAAAALGVGFVPYSPLGRGFFTGWTSTELAPDDLRRKFPRFTPERLSRNRALIEALLFEASGLQVTPAQLALAWLYAKGRAFGDSVVGRLDALASRVVGDRVSDLNWISQGREQSQEPRRS